MLLGKRRLDMKFMPGKYVFPGGRVDKADRTVAVGDDLASAEIEKLMVDMKGGPSQQRARALAHLERYRRRLWEELGERPSPEVEALLRELGG